MKEMKRILSLVLCLAMLVGMLPMFALQADAAERTLIDAAIFCSDVHGNPGTVAEVFGGIQKMDSTFKPTTAAFVGDTDGSTSTVTTKAQSVFSGVECIYAYGSHDSGYVTDFTGLSYGDSTTNYYIYTISQSSMESSNPNTSGFTSTVSGLDKTKPLFIISHMPLHDRRNDNKGAAAWYSAISAAAESMDIFFFWAHNHTGDDAVDQAAYYVANSGSETITIEGGDTVTPNFTYANAGYIDPPNNAARVNVATAVYIYNDSVDLVVCNADGLLTGSYAVDVTVDRLFAPKTETTPVLNGIEAVSNKETYYVGEDLDITVYEVYSDGSRVLVEEGYTTQGFDNNTLGTQTVTVTYGDYNTTVSVTVVEQDAEPVLTGIQVTYTKETLLGEALTLKVVASYDNGTTVELAEGDYTVEGYDPAKTGVQGVVVTYKTASYGFNVINTNEVTVVADGMKTLTVTDVSETLTDALAEELEAGFVAYDIDPDAYNVTKNIAVVSMPAPEGANAVYYWNQETQALEPVTDFTFQNGKVVFTTNHFSTYVVGVKLPDGSEIETEGDTAVVPGTSTTVEKNVWVKVDAPVGGGEYLIVSTGTAGTSGYIMGNSTAVTPISGTMTVDGVEGTHTYFETATGTLWTASGNGSSWTFQNGNGTYLGYSTSGSFITSYSLNTTASSATTWTLSNNNLYFTTTGWGSTTYRYIAGGSSWSLGSSSGSAPSSANVYFYQQVPVIITEGTVGHTYTAEGINVTDAVALEGQTVTLTSKLWDTPDGGTATEVTTLTPTYEIVTTKGNPAVISSISGSTATLSGVAGTAVVKVTYTSGGLTAWDEFLVTAVVPTFDFALTEETATVKIGASHTLTANRTMNGADTTLGSAVTWTSSDTAVATVADGVVSGLKAGDTTITAEWTDPAGVKHTDTVVVTVVDAVYTITIDQGETHIHKGVQNGQTLKLTATVTRDEQTVENPSLTWSILSGGNLASIDASTGTLTFNGNEGEMEVKVEYKVNETTTLVDYIIIHVHKSTAITPEESTTDFPRWPNEGAVRFDKTAQAVGNFSNTGVAQMELSMAGIPSGGSDPFDVVLVLDLSNSMEQSSRTTYLIAAAKAFMETICLNEDGTWNELEHGVSIISYNIDPEVDFPANTTSSYTDDMKDISSIDDYNDAIDAIEALSRAGGTDYAEALKHGYEVLSATKDPARKQYLIFMSDGAPTSYAYLASSQVITSSKHTESTIATGVYTENGVTYNAYLVDQGTSTGSSYELSTSTLIDYDEYYSYLMKQNGVEIYSVGLAISSTTGKQVLSHISSAADTETDSADNSHAFFVSDGDSSKLTAAFTQMGTEMMAAATNIEVTDKITDEYEMIFEWPEAVKTEDQVTGQEFYIEVVNYELDSTTHERNGSYDVLTRIYLTENADGTLAISKLVKIEGVTSTATGTTTNLSQTPVYAEVGEGEKGYFNLVDGEYVYVSDGTGTLKMTEGATVTGTADTVELHTPYFSYKASDKIITWHVSQTAENAEIALRYFLYLTNSLESAAGTIKEKLADGTPNPEYVKPGTYETNEYATLEYTNFKGNECMQYFPKPQLTWNGAQVSYVFYLVNSDGQPVNTAGRVVTFAESVFVTKIYTESVVWNEEEGTTSLDATRVAETLLPSDYELYDDTTKYEIHVYQNENGDDIYNYFVITAGGGTTIVYNTKAGIKYSNPGTYTKDNVDNNFDFANTTVAFAVVWERKLVEDTVVIDFGLPVDINVTTNDFVYNSITAIGTNTPTNVDINDGLYNESALSFKVDESTGMSGLLSIGKHTAQVINENVIRFTPGSMEFDDAIQFNYETKTDYYEDSTVKEGYLYSTVTVIPATTIYYEDEYVTLTTHKQVYTQANAYEADKTYYTKNEDGTYAQAKDLIAFEEGVTYYTMAYESENGWPTNSTAASATQAQDRPGKSQIQDTLDADNNYGYDEAYSSMSTYSMSNAAKITVSAGVEGQATFDFYGTGFDVISMTDTTTGTIVVQVYAYDDQDKLEADFTKSYVVDTYYGYKLNEDGKWVTTTSNDPNALYQVPVMKISGLDYGKYQAKILVLYDEFFDNVGDGSYDFYLDAIRIYDPTGNQNDEVNAEYVKDNEGWPTYKEVRDYIIDAKTFENVATDAVNGIVFIDGIGNTATVSDYESYGPNNELYLAPGQAITFTLTSGTNVAKLQMALKTVTGSAKVEIYTVVNAKKDEVILNKTINTATDMYYTLWETVKNADGTYNQAPQMILVIMNSGESGVLSITNVKTTYTAEPVDTASVMMFAVRRSSVDAALATMNVEEEVPETTVPETTVPEETEPETTVPETTVPEETEPETTVPEETQEPTEAPTEEPTEPEETEPSVEEQVREAIKEIGKVIKKIFGWIFG